MKTDTYNAVVIGRGQAGRPLATSQAEARQETAIIEAVRSRERDVVDLLGKLHEH